MLSSRCLIAVALLLALVVPAFAQPAIGDAAPDFRLPDVRDGSQFVELGDFEGKWLLLAFWISSDDTCQYLNEERLEPFVERFADAEKWELVSVGVPLRGENAGRQFGCIQQQGYSWRFVFDARGRMQEAYGVAQVPELILVNDSGEIVAAGIDALITLHDAIVDRPPLADRAEDLESESAMASIAAYGDKVWRYTTEEAGLLMIQTTGSMDTVMEVWDAAGETLVLSNDDLSDSSVLSRCMFQTAAGATWLIRIYAYDADRGRFGLNVVMPITGTLASRSTRMSGSSTSTSVEFMRDTVLRVEIEQAGEYTVETDGRFDTVLWLYDGDEELVAENDDIDTADGNYNSRITFEAGADTVWYVRLMGYSGSAGRTTVKLRAS